MNTSDVKQRNTALILRTLSVRKTATVKDIASCADLTTATVGGIIYQLVQENVVLRQGELPPRGGRPSQVYEMNTHYAYILTVAVYVSHGRNIIHAQVSDLSGASVHVEKEEYGQIDLAVMDSIIAKCISRFPKTAVLAISIPGAENKGEVLTCDYAELEGVDLVKHYQDKHGISVLVENDVNIAVAGYATALTGQGTYPSVLAGVYFPRNFNPGSGILIDGKIFKGARGYGGEISYIPFGWDWSFLNYSDVQLLVTYIGKLIKTLCAVFNPERIVLYGDFFTQGLQNALSHEISGIEHSYLIPSLIFKDRVEDDIMAGLIQCALASYQDIRWDGGTTVNTNQIPAR